MQIITEKQVTAQVSVELNGTRAIGRGVLGTLEDVS